MFSNCKESAGRSLVGRLIKDGSQPEDCVGSPQARLQAWIRVRVGMLGPLLSLDPFRPSERRCWAKIHGTHIAPIFSTGEFDLPQSEKY